MTKLILIDFDDTILDQSLFRSSYPDSVFVSRSSLEAEFKNYSYSYATKITEFCLQLNNQKGYPLYKSLIRSCANRHYSYSYLLFGDLTENITLLSSFAYDFLSKNSPDHVIFSNIPHEPYEISIAFICHVMGIPSYSFYHVGGYLPNFVTLYKNAPFNQTLVRTYGNIRAKNLSILQTLNSIDSNTVPFYVPKSSSNLLSQVIRSIFWHSRSLVSSFRHFSLFNVFYSILALSKALACISFVMLRKRHIYCAPFNIFEDYIYLPLQYEPELASSIPHNTDILSSYSLLLTARQKFSSSIPIVIRENPAQYLGSRNIEFYKFISQLSNVFIDNKHTHSQLLSCSLAVVVGRSTPGLEALLQGKPVFSAFKSQWYYEALSQDICSYAEISIDDIKGIKKFTPKDISFCLASRLHYFFTDPCYARQYSQYSKTANTTLIAQSLRTFI